LQICSFKLNALLLMLLILLMFFVLCGACLPVYQTVPCLLLADGACCLLRHRSQLQRRCEKRLFDAILY
jgi:hypothetical protein